MQENLFLKSDHYVNATIDLPGSKSISNRALLLAALSKGNTVLYNVLNSDDVMYMLNALSQLGIKYNILNKTTYEIFGSENNFQIKNKLELYLGNAGTVMRPLTAILSLKKNNVVLTGDKRMQERPIGDLINALCQGGAKIKYIKKDHYPPIKIQGGFIGGKITIDGSISSQFLSAILIAAPLAENNTEVLVKNSLVSKPYIDITLNLMKTFGISVKNDDYNIFYIKGNQNYISPKKYQIEGDASSASYFFAAAAISGIVRVNGVGCNSIQGDIQFLQVLEKMGVFVQYYENYITCKKNILNAINLDMNHIPDAAMTVAILALFAQGRTTIRNIYNWRVKETDRLHAMTTELRKIGAEIEEGYDYLCVTPPKIFQHAKIDTYHDHRMAMCFSLLAFCPTGVTISDPKCVSKTFPNYFSLFKKTFKIS